MLNIVIPMAGRGSRFAQAGFTTPKPLIPVGGRPMIQWVIENIRPARPHRFTFLCLAEHLEQYPEVPEELRRLCPGCAHRPGAGSDRRRRLHRPAGQGVHRFATSADDREQRSDRRSADRRLPRRRRCPGSRRADHDLLVGSSEMVLLPHARGWLRQRSGREASGQQRGDRRHLQFPRAARISCARRMR